jgi:aspartyl-tRNA(Asn)/glutamyl-tRNA(Gln) amidotransferase subunit B
LVKRSQWFLLVIFCAYEGTDMAEQKAILSTYPNYVANIGIEVHVQLTTKSKIFCSCANIPGQTANQNICNICTGQPGSLPVLNKRVVDFAILAGLATNCTINKCNSFARKHYFYPDLPKNYQITQSDDPICSNGYIPIRLEDGSIKKIRLIRIHMEEDAGKSIHTGLTNESLIDFNRTGTPLLEIVSHPDIASAHEAREYLKALHSIVTYLGICTGNMEEGAFRADTNISVRKKDSEKLGTKIELKNINSFKYISDAIEYEIERQIKTLEEGRERLRQETRLWDSKEKKSFVMRSKEEAADYRYFHDPDLPILDIDDSWINSLKAQLPELPFEKFNRLVKEKEISAYEAGILIEDRTLADYFEETTKHSTSKQIINWVLRDLLGYAKEQKISVTQCKVTPVKLATIIELLEEGTINGPAAKELFLMVAQTGNDPISLVKSKGLEQIGSVDELEAIIKEIIVQNPREVARYKAGAEKLFGFFVGQAMAKTKGKGNPKLINELLKKYLA